MSDNRKRPVTLDDLLRVKRAERPPKEFWSEWERELHVKQLAAIVEERPWWQVRVPALVRTMARWQLPVGAAAVMALTFVTVREYRGAAEARPQVSVENAAPVVVTADTASALPETAARVNPLQADSTTVALVTTPPVAVVPQTSTPVETSPSPRIGELVPHLMVPTLMVAGANQLGMNDQNQPGVMALDRTPAQEPLARIATVKDARRSRLLDSAMGSAYAKVANAEMTRTHDRVASRLSDDRFYEDEPGRLGAAGDRLSFRF